MLKRICVVVALAFAFPASAGAAWSPPEGWVPYFEASAIHAWSGGTDALPPCGVPILQWVDPDTLNAYHGFRTVADADESDCVIRFASDQHPEPNELCDTVVHEMGHLYGHGHSKRGVMSPGSAPWTQIPACARVLCVRPWTDREGFTWEGFRLRTGARPFRG